MTVSVAALLSSHIARVSEMPDDELDALAGVVERALVHFLVEQQLRVASVSQLRAV